MTIPGRAADTKTSHSTPSDSASQVAIDDAHSNHRTTGSCTGDSAIALDVFDSPVLPPPDPAELASAEKTRPALLKLGESPGDTAALTALWDENRFSIEHEMRRHLHFDS